MSMRATDVLSSDHRLIERVIAALGAAARRLEANEAVRPGFFLDAARFIQGFADGCHHRKEEGVLFRAMNEHGMPTEAGPIAVMLHEHEMGRAYTRAMREAAERLQAGDEAAKAEVAAAARGYAAVLSQHIMKEDNILFPMAARVIPQSEHDDVFEAFERVEAESTGAGEHDRYVALAEALEQEAAAVEAATSS
jgi:hemerythrin-like domain-containing protein